jgi:hypothetical protein
LSAREGVSTDGLRGKAQMGAPMLDVDNRIFWQPDLVATVSAPHQKATGVNRRDDPDGLSELANHERPRRQVFHPIPRLVRSLRRNVSHPWCGIEWRRSPDGAIEPSGLRRRTDLVSRSAADSER